MGMKVKNVRSTGTRQDIISAFIQLANKKDFEKVSVQDISMEAKINRATFYAHFEDKYQLVNEIIGGSAESIILKHTTEDKTWNEQHIEHLMLAVNEYLEQVKNKCSRGYDNCIPFLRKEMLEALTNHLETTFGNNSEVKEFDIKLMARIIFESVYISEEEQPKPSQKQISDRVINLILNNFL